MTKIVDLINSLPDMLPLKPATEVQITDAELQLRVIFADEYKEYLKAFGSIMADGIELAGIAKAEHRNVVSLTKKERELNPKVPHTMYVIENTCVDGIIIWQDTNGSIYQTTPNAEPLKIASSLEEYLSNRIK
ncbi:MAG: SMI1/KNR4 family protein [Monoglobales bacterium]